MRFICLVVVVLFLASCGGDSAGKSDGQSPMLAAQATPLLAAGKDAHFGIHIGGPLPPNFPANLPNILSQIDALGAGSVRVNLLWACSGPNQACVEKSEGQLDWTLADTVINQFASAGLSLLVNVRGYSCSFPCDELTLLYAATPEKKLQAYESFLRTLVGRYRGKVRFWQIENEVEGRGFWRGSAEEYVTVLKTAYRVIKAEDPASQALRAGFAVDPFTFSEADLTDPGGPTSTTGRTSAEQLGRALDGSKGNFDIVDLHLYVRPELMPPAIAILRRSLAERAITAPFWVTETGGPLPSAACPGVSSEPGPDYQAGEVLKRSILALSSGADRVFWHSLLGPADPGMWVCTGPARSNFNFMPLVRGGEKRAAFSTFTLMTTRLGNFNTIQRLDLGSGTNAFEVRRSGGSVYVGWADMERVVSLPATGPLQVTSWDGRTEQRGPGSLTLGALPVLIEAAR